MPIYGNISKKVALQDETTKVIGTVNNKVADGSDITLGAKADAAATVADATPFSVIALLKGIWNKLASTLTVQVSGSKVEEGIADFILNTEGTLLASAARTANIATPLQINYNAKGVFLWLNVTVASGAGGLTLIVQGIDPISGLPVWLNATPTAVTTTGTFGYELYPGGTLSGDVKQRTSGILPRSWKVLIAVGDASSYTYSLGYSLIL